MFGIEFEGRSSRLHCGCVRREDPEEKAINVASPRLLEAYRAAAAVSSA
jgi:hypothetical protein